MQAAEGCVKGLTGPRWGLLSPGKQTGWALGRRSSSWEGAVTCGTPGGRHRPPCGVATAPGSSAGPSLPSCAVGAVGGLSGFPICGLGVNPSFLVGSAKCGAQPAVLPRPVRCRKLGGQAAVPQSYSPGPASAPGRCATAHAHHQPPRGPISPRLTQE